MCTKHDSIANDLHEYDKMIRYNTFQYDTILQYNAIRYDLIRYDMIFISYKVR